MKNKEDLKKELLKIDHKSYGMYKTLGGSYSFGNYILYIDHVQGDPFASPSRLHFEVKLSLIHIYGEIPGAVKKLGLTNLIRMSILSVCREIPQRCR